MIDTDLRWRIVTALAAAGDLDADGPETPFIDAEAERDPTAAGQRNAARGRGRSSAGRGQGARRGSRSIEDDTLANITARAIIGGFVQPGQGELLAAVHASATSTPSPGCGSAGPARSRRRWWSGCTRRGTSARPRLDAADAFLADRTCRRRCAGWCSRAAQVSSGRCGPGPSTPADLGRG